MPAACGCARPPARATSETALHAIERFSSVGWVYQMIDIR
jgi:hypothetical protein